MKVKSSLFKLDSNINGTYIDKDGNVHTIENMIQAVGATDGPAIQPTTNILNAKISADELNLVPDLTIAVNTLGHGILYDKEGVPVAYKGDLVLRDGLGNVVTLNNASSKVNSISEEGKDVFLRDKSLQEFNNSEKGVSLDDLITASIQQTARVGGNIVQATRNEATNRNSISVFTTNLSEKNHIWIVGSVMVNQTTKIQLRDITTDTILDIGYISPKQTNIYPLYVSYTGTLELLIGDNAGVSANTCDPFIWNSFLKKHFKVKDTNNALVQSHEIALEIVEGGNFITGNINLLAMDDNVDNQFIFSGQEVVSDKDNIIIKFPSSMTNTTYSITIQSETPIQTWYESKSNDSFNIRFERKYTGRVFWSAILMEK